MLLVLCAGTRKTGEQKANRENHSHVAEAAEAMDFVKKIDSLASQLVNPRGLARLRRSASAGSVVESYWSVAESGSQTRCAGWRRHASV
jgi:hypothetical protein